jgi:hypothetical protein
MKACWLDKNWLEISPITPIRKAASQTAVFTGIYGIGVICG